MLMFEEADAFVVLPGGIGTLEEVIELLSWRRLGLHAKPIVFYHPTASGTAVRPLRPLRRDQTSRPRPSSTAGVWWSGSRTSFLPCATCRPTPTPVELHVARLIEAAVPPCGSADAAALMVDG